METPKTRALVTTAKERCRVCYTCVRECPAKAIRIVDGQAEILPERCIACGNCVRVCSQDAKEALDSVPEVKALFDSGSPVVACVAPSFPVVFGGEEFQHFVGMMRTLGFAAVTEVGFGADLVARRYADILNSDIAKRYIATSCPAVVAYVERYHPALVDALAPVVSPMIAMARVLRRIYGEEAKLVFVGPCIAKKGEIASSALADELDAALTFIEIERMFEANGIYPADVKPSDFDGPRAGLGALFAISRGLLQAANIREDLMSGDVVATDGRTSFVEAVREFDTGDLDARLLEVLACEGCIMGPGINVESPLFSRRKRVSKYVRERMACLDEEQWKRDLDKFGDISLDQKFYPYDMRIPVADEREMRAVMTRMGKRSPADELNCGACGYETCREHAIAIIKGLAETEMCLPHTIDRLRLTIGDLDKSHKELARTQEALVQSEKLASMGQLAAGIAHELNNPLGIVLMYAHLVLDDLKKEGQGVADVEMIATQADRCKKIVAGLLHFARQNKVEHRPTDLREIVTRSIEATHVPDNIAVRVNHAMDDNLADLDEDQLIQVFTNLFGNACAAMPAGGELTVATHDRVDKVEVVVSDTGTGIDEETRKRIFEPFFTTKEIGEGTGLGLAVAYGIVKMHSGDIRVESNADSAQGPTGTRFTVSLARRGPQAERELE